MDYRDHLYQKYHESQEGRILTNLKDRLQTDRVYFRKEIEPYLPTEKNSPILDIGCGYGSVLHLLAEKGMTHARGIDISTEQIELAKQSGLKKVEQADIFSWLPQQQVVYGLIICQDVIEHLTKSEQLQLLALCYEKLEHGGHLVMRTPNMDAPFASVYGYGDLTHESLWNKHAAEQILSSSGFSEFKILGSKPWANQAIKRFMQKIGWKIFTSFMKLGLFTSGHRAEGVLFDPNLLLIAKKT